MALAVYTAQDFNRAMLIMPVAFFVALIITFFMRETYCRSQANSMPRAFIIMLDSFGLVQPLMQQNMVMRARILCVISLNIVRKAKRIKLACDRPSASSEFNPLGFKWCSDD